MSIPKICCLGIVAATLTLIGCNGQPETGSMVAETPEKLKQREEGVSDAMKRGAYGDQYKNSPRAGGQTK